MCERVFCMLKWKTFPGLKNCLFFMKSTDNVSQNLFISFVKYILKWLVSFINTQIYKRYQIEKVVLDATLQIFIVILLCKSIKIIGVIYNLMIENFFSKFHRWNPVIAKHMSKSSKNKSPCWPKLLSVCNRFWYECKIESIGNNL